MPLTDVVIRSARPTTRALKLYNSGGLYLEVSPSGGKWWRLKYRFHGNENRISLGVYPETTLRHDQNFERLLKKRLGTSSA
jgi:hypothetical protein